MLTYQEIPLGKISSNPLNPRRSFEGPKFDELCTSVKQKGVIEPIIVRPRDLKNEKTDYQIVAGERRFRAAGAAGLETIPAIVRDLSDDEAYDFMLIENIQRDNLTELEEATSFKAWTVRHSKTEGEAALAIRGLAEKTGIRPAYIRARIAVLALPDYILEAWRKGILCFGHLEQFLRLTGKDSLKKVFEVTKVRDLSVAELKRQISEDQIPMSAAKFDIKKSCAGCRSNSTVQQDLFGLGDGKAACLNPKCFKGKQGVWLKEHWLETDYAKKDKTRGFRFDDDLSWDKKHEFYGKPAEKCFQCDSFVTLLKATGDRREYRQIACVGDKSCFNKARAAGRAEESASTREAKKKAADAGKAPRVAWHGEYFRNVFFKKRVPEVLAGLKPEDPKVKTLLVMCLAHANNEARVVVQKAFGMRADPFIESATLFSKLLALPYAKISAIFRSAIEAVFQEGQNVGDWSGFGSKKRRLVAEFLGINLAKEYAVGEEYLQKKTKNELLAFGKKSGIFADPKVKSFLAAKKKPPVENLKKSELVDVFLKSGVILTGKVPAEILDKK